MTSQRTFVGLRSVRPRIGPPRAIVLHWTGGIARSTKLDTDGDGIPNHIDTDDDADGLPDFLDPDAVDVGSLELLFRVLRATKGRRTPDGISVHVGIAPDGITERWAPDELVCLTAGIVNDWTLNVEVCCPGYSHVRGQPSRAWTLEQERGIVRREYADRIHGVRVRMVDYTNAQLEAVAHLVEGWCDRWGIPRDVPRERDGSLMRRLMTPAELASFRGVMGHFHCNIEKNDPGTSPLLWLARRWGHAIA